MGQPEYRYEFRELASGRPLGEIALYGVYFTVKLSDGGSGQGSFKLDGSNLPSSYTEADIARANAEMLEMTRPGYAEIVIYRDGQPLLGGGGSIISQSYQSQAKIVSVYWRTWESFPEFVTIDETVGTLSWTNVDQLNIMRDLWNTMQSQPGANPRVTVPAAYSGVSVGRTLQVPYWDRKTYRAVMDELAKADDGFDWRVVTRMHGDMPTKYLEMGYPEIGRTSDAFFFEYPKNVDNYYYTRNIQAGGTHFWVTGEGSGQEAPVGRAVDYDALGRGFHRKDMVISDNQLSSGLVQPRADLEARVRKLPNANPTIELSDSADFGTWWVGDWGRLSWAAGDPFFPDGYEMPARVIQIEVNPPSDTDTERIRPTLQELDGEGG
jgi:hypothetical protein